MSITLRESLFGSDDMTSCRQAMRHLQAAIDGELDEPTLARVNRHFEACRKCGMAAETYRAIKVAIAASNPEPLPQDLLDDLTTFAHGLPRED